MMSKAGPKGDGGGDGSGSSSKDEQQQQQQQREDQYDDADYEPEPEEKVSIVKTVAGLCLLGLVLAALGATVTELWPSHMAPQSIMSHAHDVFQADPDVSLSLAANNRTALLDFACRCVAACFDRGTCIESPRRGDIQPPVGDETQRGMGGKACIYSINLPLHSRLFQ